MGGELALKKKPPPLVPNITIGHLRGHRPHTDRLAGAFHACHHGVRAEVLDPLPWPMRENGEDQAGRQQQIKVQAHQVHPEIPHRRGFDPGDAPHQGKGHGDAHRRRKEVMQGQGHHLNKVGGRAFRAVSSANWCWW